MQNIYDTREKWKMGFFIVAFMIALSSIFISHRFVSGLAKEEQSKMEIWAEATKQASIASENDDQTLVLSVLQSNKTIPVIVADDSLHVLWHKNIDILDENCLDEYLAEKLQDLKIKNNVIVIDLGEEKQYLYYDESVILKQLSYYPYILLLIISIFILLAYWVLNSTKRAEQNQVWVGLSKETAHQLGTPISSLLAWVELLKCNDKIDQSLISDMNKDVQRLLTIADRFSKIGSHPKPIPADLNDEIVQSLDYMRKRVSEKVSIICDLSEMNNFVLLNNSLFEWVIENLCKNAIDAMEGQGIITVRSFQSNTTAVVEISDTGKGISKSKFKTIFNPGYTTKKRGWGLGLTLVKRIVEEYHEGKIFVKESELNVGTTFRIELRIATVE